MGFWSFLLLVILILAGVMLYHRLQLMERDIRKELQDKERASKPLESNGQSDPETTRVEDVQSRAANGNKSIEEQLLLLLRGEPGIMQTEIYRRFPECPRKRLQSTLRAMDQAGQLKREKAKGSYRLFAA